MSENTEKIHRTQNITGFLSAGLAAGFFLSLFLPPLLVLPIGVVTSAIIGFCVELLQFRRQSVTIGEPTRQDWQQIKDVLLLAYGSENESRRLRKNPLKPKGLVAKRKNEVVGFLALEEIPLLPAGTTAPCITALAVMPKAQGRGIGKLLVSECLQKARKQGVLSVFCDKEHAFFLAYGFQPAGELCQNAALFYPCAQDMGL